MITHRCKDMAAWSKQAEAAAQAALQTGTAVDDFFYAIRTLAALHARKVISADINTKQVLFLTSGDLRADHVHHLKPVQRACSQHVQPCCACCTAGM